MSDEALDGAGAVAEDADAAAAVAARLSALCVSVVPVGGDAWVLCRARLHQCVHQWRARCGRVGISELVDEHICRVAVQAVAVVVEYGERCGLRWWLGL